MGFLRWGFYYVVRDIGFGVCMIGGEIEIRRVSIILCLRGYGALFADLVV